MLIIDTRISDNWYTSVFGILRYFLRKDFFILAMNHWLFSCHVHILHVKVSLTLVHMKIFHALSSNIIIACHIYIDY